MGTESKHLELTREGDFYQMTSLFFVISMDYKSLYTRVNGVIEQKTEMW